MKIGVMCLCVVCTLFCSVGKSFAEGPTELVIGSSNEEDIAYSLVSEMATFCKSEVFTIRLYTDEAGKPVGGELINLQNLLKNRVMAGISTVDVAHLERSYSKSVERIVTLLPLHQKHLYFIVPTKQGLQTKTGDDLDLMKFFEKELTRSKDDQKKSTETLSSVSDLKKRKVVSYGTSRHSAKVISRLTEMHFAIIVANNHIDALQMLDTGEVDALLIVEHPQTGITSTLENGKYKLLSVDEETKNKLGSVYSVSEVYLENMGSSGQKTQVLTVDIALFTRVYHTPSIVKALSGLRTCVKDNMYTIKDTYGTNPVWQEIDLAREIKWDQTFSDN